MQGFLIAASIKSLVFILLLFLFLLWIWIKLKRLTDRRWMTRVLLINPGRQFSRRAYRCHTVCITTFNTLPHFMVIILVDHYSIHGCTSWANGTSNKTFSNAHSNSLHEQLLLYYTLKYISHSHWLCLYWIIPLCLNNGSVLGLWPRKSINSFIASSEPPFSKIVVKNCWPVI